MHTTRTNCRICPDGSDALGRYDAKDVQRDTKLVPILNLGSTPLADKFVTDPSKQEFSAPLNVGVCPTCHCVELMDIVDDALLFSDDYAFYTGASLSSIPYFKAYAQDVMKRFPELCEGGIIEVASNDGTLLKHFQDAGYTVMGIEPTANTAQQAIDSGVPTLVASMSTDLGVHWPKQDKASIVIGNNVLAHVDDLHDFIGGCTAVLKDGGVLIFEVQYFPHLLFNNAFDHVYHEHRSFFTLSTLVWLLHFSFLTIFDVQEADTQGGSIRVFAKQDYHHELPISPAVTAMLKEEKALGLDKLETYQSFQPHVDYTRHKLVKLLKDLKAQDKTIYGFGASAKGNTLLNTCGIGPELLDCIVDTTPYKIGKFSPGMHIPVVAPGERKDPDYYLVLVWNYLPGILKREETYRRSGGHFIVPIPSPVII